MTGPWDPRWEGWRELEHTAFFREMEERGRAGEHIVLELDVTTAMAVLACIQLALRHPANIGPSAKLARAVADGLEKMLGTTPAIAEVCRKGWDPQYDA